MSFIQCAELNHLFITGKDCADLFKKGHTTTGVYSIDPDGKGAFRVRCDMTTSGGGGRSFKDVLMVV